MNPRELMSRADRRCRADFLKLPPELQDEIIDGLDSTELTYPAASKLLKSRGFDLSFQAIQKFHRKLKRECRKEAIIEAGIQIRAKLPPGELRDLARANLSEMLSGIAQALADGEMTPTVLDAMRMAMVLEKTHEKSSGQDQQDGPDQEDKKAGGLTDEKADELRMKFLKGQTGG